MPSVSGFISSVPVISGKLGLSKRLRATSFYFTRRPRLPAAPSTPSQRTIISANSLEESKRRARSQYDNIPDLNQRYISELGWVERKYGPKRLKKKIIKEAQQSILRPDGPSAPSASRTTKIEEPGSDGNGEADLEQYNRIRSELLVNTIFVGMLGFCVAWGFGTVKEVQSFMMGLVGSMAYVYLLSRSVDRMATAARETGTMSGDALQPARLAILVLLVIASAKNSDKLSVLPVLFGFFTYKVATLLPLLTGEAFE
ncbi:putative ATP synthase protein [Chondrus crispus]|uniref:Putative ATP synthase protein n=1 Tax=Chondrus crispus TaxID=2769 RepID=R7Q4B7_CHOCR|nr:putative ATP synthase protein [Chondrus crispus]CDF33367.1 putative ATP synthase protein [Chondrus crispus]|eukprot:XP_005713170.1 putative ATP synthase protein [Chondrus crispus]